MLCESEEPTLKMEGAYHLYHTHRYGEISTEACAIGEQLANLDLLTPPHGLVVGCQFWLTCISFLCC